MRSLWRKSIVVLCGVALIASGSACSSSSENGDGGSPAGGGSGGGTYSAAEVATATGVYKVRPLFAVPKTLPERYRFAFINPSLSYPYFATWSQGMKDAAKFYGVDLDEADMNFKYDTELNAYQQVAVKQPKVIGSGQMNDATYHAAQRDGTKIVLIDGTFKDVPHFGVDDKQVGKLAIDTMADQAKAKMAGAWQGRNVVVAGITSANCTPCDTRVKASFAEAQAKLGIPAKNTTMLTPPGQDPTSSAASTFTDFLTAHPGDVVLVVSYGDEPVIGAINAAKAAGRKDDILAVSNGGDSAARIALRDPSNAGVLVASIDYQPYAEGWNWIEAAIATAMGQPFDTYRVDRVLTAANVDQFYPNDKTGK
ncbi:sugar ABC transporter substrate-binding protein [Nonomuraea sp. M3C6]|uniref:Sugar ABC transporter substrate-binding protein n=1 Tax=Nonomuraea marmarensis TaxID=3351344 RepID=A0ABW7AI40_9ACTN